MTKDFNIPNFPKMPEIKTNKNGYEIRTEVLSMAKDVVFQEYHSKYMGWEVANKRDEKTGEIVTKVTMPEFPGLDKVLETAQKMYDFITATNTKK